MRFTQWGWQKQNYSASVCAKIMGSTPPNYTVHILKTTFIVKMLTWLSRPRSSSMIKKRMAQRVGIGIMDTALG